jgi:hypothetical protein
MTNVERFQEGRAIPPGLWRLLLVTAAYLLISVAVAHL